MANLITLKNNLKITPYHPVMTHGCWMYPVSISQFPNMVKCDAVYTILLDSGHTFNLNGHWVIGIGHNYKLGILAHDYFGSNLIIQDLQKLDGWESGFITIDPSYFVRDCIRENGNITGIQKPFIKSSSVLPSMSYSVLTNI